MNCTAWECKNCGEQNHIADEKCQHCGKEYGWDLKTAINGKEIDKGD